MTKTANILERVKAPLLNANEDEIVVVDVCLADGEQVAKDQLIFVVESTKTTSEVTAPAAGFIRNIQVTAGEQVPVGTILCVIADRADGQLEDQQASESVEAAIASTQQSATQNNQAKHTALAPLENGTAKAANGNANANGNELLATKPAQALADEHKLDLAELGQPELNQIITRRDVQAFLNGNPAPAVNVDASFPVARETSKAPTTPDTPSSAEPTDAPKHLPFPTSPTSPTSIRQSSVPQLVVFGAGSHAGAVIELIRRSRPEIRIVAAVDDAANRKPEISGVPVVGDSHDLKRLFQEGIRYAALGIGAAKNPELRKKLFARLESVGFELPSFIHPQACVEPSVSMQHGNQIFAGAVIGTNVTLGDNTLINCGCVVSHDCELASHVHITPGAILAGAVKVGENSTIGMASTVFLGTTIGKNVIVGNGVHIFDNVPDGTFVRPRKSLRKAA